MKCKLAERKMYYLSSGHLGVSVWGARRPHLRLEHGQDAVQPTMRIELTPHELLIRKQCLSVYTQ